MERTEGVGKGSAEDITFDVKNAHESVCVRVSRGIRHSFGVFYIYAKSCQFPAPFPATGSKLDVQH